MVCVTRSIQGKENDFDEQLWAGPDLMEGRCLQSPGEEFGAALLATPREEFGAALLATPKGGVASNSPPGTVLGPPEGVKYSTPLQLIRN